MSKGSLYNRADAGTFFSSTNTFNFLFAQQKIQQLAKLGFVFIGSLPTYYSVPTAQKIASFLLMHDGVFYQYKGPHFLQFGDVDETHLVKIQNEHFIYLAVKEEEQADANLGSKSVLFLKENAALQGHHWLAGPYNKRPALFYTQKLSSASPTLLHHLSLLEGFPQAAYVLVKDKLFYVKKVKQLLVAEKLSISDQDLLQLLHLSNQTGLPSEHHDFCKIQQELSLQCIEIIQKATGHMPMQHIIIGGEIYFLNGNILLINNKSGSFHSDAESAFSLLQEIFVYTNLTEVYSPFIEERVLEKQSELVLG